MAADAGLYGPIALAASEDGDRLWRFPIGGYELKGGRWIIVGSPGMSDMIGLTRVTITPDMIGQTLAVFTAVEAKAPGARTDKARLALQTNFIEMVNRLGGRAGFADSVEQSRIIRKGSL